MNKGRLMLANGGRIDAKKIMIVLTNGLSRPIKPNKIAEVIRTQQHAEIYALSTSKNNLDIKQLLEITEKPANHLNISRYCKSLISLHK
ncbi:unnamed protein product [Gordionus sp. m RMFG-2023]